MRKHNIVLTDEEVIVLHNYLAARVDRIIAEANKRKWFDMNDPDFAERVVLNNLNNVLEALDPAEFAVDYKDRLRAAQKVVTDGYSSDLWNKK